MTDKTLDNVFILLGALGALILVGGLATTVPKTYYVAGSFLLLLTAIHYRLIFFIALELIMFSGHGAVILGIGPRLQLALPILLCVQLLIYYVLNRQLNNIYIVIGIIGIALLSIGFAYENQWLSFIGSLSIAFYATFLGYREQKIIYLWTILNFILALVALNNIYTA